MAAALTGTTPPLVRPAQAEGHCDFTPAQNQAAYQTLVDWGTRGQRPATP